MVEVSIICDKVRFEEKALYEKTQKKGIKSKIVDAKTITIGTHSKKKDFLLGDVILQRSVSYYRGLYLTASLEYLGFKVINRFEVGQTCGNKLITSIKLAENKIPSPKTQFAFSAESGLESIKNNGFPLVLKPIVGSWGRGIYPLRDLETASMIIEMREEDDSPLSRIYYIQEMVDRPPREHSLHSSRRPSRHCHLSLFFTIRMANKCCPGRQGRACADNKGDRRFSPKGCKSCGRRHPGRGYDGRQASWAGRS